MSFAAAVVAATLLTASSCNFFDCKKAEVAPEVVVVNEEANVQADVVEATEVAPVDVVEQAVQEPAQEK